MLLAIMLALLACAQAETIRLKNGRVILAEHVQESGNKVEYTIGESTFAIQRSSVERIDTGGVPIVTHHEDMSAPEPAQNAIRVPVDLEAKLLKDGKLDTDYLAEVERTGGDDRAAAANYLAFRFEHEGARYDAAYRYIERARTFAPGNTTILGQEAAQLVDLGKLTEAVVLAERAIGIAPNEAFAYTVLGYCYFQQSKTAEAIKMFKKSLSLQPDPQVQGLLAKAERELKAETGFEEEASSHFNLRFEGKTTDPALRRQLLAVLEQN
jgi:tetratricopeptide (TPR) repeat protein